MDANQHMHMRGAHTVNTELTRTPARALAEALTVGPLDCMMSYVLFSTNCVHFCRQIHPHVSHSATDKDDESSIVYELQKSEK